MAKLNKQEVTAIANKLRRELIKAAEDKRTEAIKAYTPSEGYKHLERLLNARDEVLELKAKYEDKYCDMVDSIEKHLAKIYSIYWNARKKKEELLDMVIDTECKLSAVPSIDELKEDVTIAAIDDSFDTAAFIEQQLAKFQ